VGRNPPPLFKGEKMPVKYSILSSHADASPKSGTKTSNYPSKKHSKNHEKTESKAERKAEYGSKS
jgi:hypothetical protein